MSRRHAGDVVLAGISAMLTICALACAGARERPFVAARAIPSSKSRPTSSASAQPLPPPTPPVASVSVPPQSTQNPCDTWAIDACMTLAREAASPDDAFSAYRKMCRLGVVEACRKIANRMTESNHHDEDTRRVIYLEACEGGALWACGPAGLLVAGHKEISAARRRELLAVGCEYGFTQACLEAATLFALSDTKRAAKLRVLGTPPPPPKLPPQESASVPWSPKKETVAVLFLLPLPPPPPPSQAERCHDGDDAAACFAIKEDERACSLGSVAACDRRCSEGNYESCALASAKVRDASAQKAAKSSLPKLFARCAAARAKLMKEGSDSVTTTHKVLRLACEGVGQIVESAIEAATDWEVAPYTELMKTHHDTCRCDE
jgi:hypothetical protein